MTYDASRYGLGITAAQFKAIKDGNSGNNNDGGNNNPQNNPGNNPDPQTQPQPEDSGDENPEVNPSPDQPADDNCFIHEIGSDSEIKEEIESGTDQIYFICRYVAGDQFFSVRAIRSQLNESEYEIIQNMSESDINEFKGHLEAAANGINYFDNSGSSDDIRIEFGSEMIEYFPFSCVVEIEVPLTNSNYPDPTKLYYEEDGKYYDIPFCPIRNTDSAGEHIYLMFTIDRFGKFVFTNQAVNSEGSNLPVVYHVILDSQGTGEIINHSNTNTEPGNAIASPGPESSDESAGSSKSAPAIIIVFIAICACAGGAYYLKKKKN